MESGDKAGFEATLQEAEKRLMDYLEIRHKHATSQIEEDSLLNMKGYE